MVLQLTKIIKGNIIRFLVQINMQRTRQTNNLLSASQVVWNSSVYLNLNHTRAGNQQEIHHLFFSFYICTQTGLTYKIILSLVLLCPKLYTQMKAVLLPMPLADEKNLCYVNNSRFCYKRSHWHTMDSTQLGFRSDKVKFVSRYNACIYMWRPFVTLCVVLCWFL